MKVTKQILLAIFLFVFGTGSCLLNVSAQDTVPIISELKIESHYINQTVSVNGKIVNVRPTDLLTIKVKNTNGDVSFIEDKKNFNSAGDFEFVFTLRDIPIDVQVYSVHLGGSVENKDITFKYFGIAYRQGVLESIKSESSNQDIMMQKMIDNSEKFGMDFTEYNLSESLAIAVKQKLFSEMSSLTVDNLNRLFKEAVIINIFNLHLNNMDVNVLEKFSDVMGTDVTEDSHYNRLVIKKRVLDLLCQGNISSIANSKKAFDDAVIVGSFSDLERSEMPGLILENKSLFDSSAMNYYLSIKDEGVCNGIYIEMEASSYDSIDDIKTKFENLINVIKNPPAKPINNNGSSGGGRTTGNYSYVAPPVTPKTIKFIDLDNVTWATESVQKLVEMDIVNGIDEKHFMPNQLVTREQFVKMLVKAFGLLDKNATCDYDDIVKSEWYYPFIASASKIKLVNGFVDNTFGINKAITRQEMAVMAYRFASYVNKALTVKIEPIEFSDSQYIESYATEAIRALQQAGILSGVGSAEFAPNDTSTRAMAAKVIYELIK